MKNPIIFRLINKFEKTIIYNSLNKIPLNAKIFFEEVKNRLFVSIDTTLLKNNYPSIFLLTVNQKVLIKRFDSNTQCTSAGLYFGIIKKGNLLLSLEAVEYLLKNDLFSKNQLLYVNRNGEKGVLYGNDILKEMLLGGIPSGLKKNNFLLIFNGLNEIIGIAKSLINQKYFENLKLKMKIALTLVDKGYYLRKNQ